MDIVKREAVIDDITEEVRRFLRSSEGELTSRQEAYVMLGRT